MDKNKDQESTVGAVIVAAGSSLRMGGGDKLFAPLCGELLLARVLGVFQGCKAIDQIAVVVREEKVTETQELIVERRWSKVREVCIGGARRQDSVRAGLERLKGCEWVVVHDGARPLVTGDLIENGLKAAADTGAAVAAVPVTDTIKIAGPDRVVRYTPARDSMWAVQTPQVFRSEIIKKAYQRADNDVTDDASLAEQLGYKVRLYPGSYANIKVTNPDDLISAETLWQKRER